MNSSVGVCMHAVNPNVGVCMYAVDPTVGVCMHAVNLTVSDVCMQWIRLLVCVCMQ